MCDYLETTGICPAQLTTAVEEGYAQRKMKPSQVSQPGSQAEVQTNATTLASSKRIKEILTDALPHDLHIGFRVDLHCIKKSHTSHLYEDRDRDSAEHETTHTCCFSERFVARETIERDI